jgi:ABC-type siderophore export system fused ATPase/permease subunit
MKPLPTILTTIAILGACIGIAALTGFDITWLTIIGTAIWIAIDSKKIEIRKYKSGISYGPVVLFFATCLLWIAAFPWYLIVKERIKSGKAALKEEKIEQGGAANPLPPSAPGDC